MNLKYTGSNLAYINQELLKLEQGKSWRLSVTEWKKKRSLPANRAYQSWYPAISVF